MSATTDHYLAEFARQERRLAGAQWFSPRRHEALRAFAAAGFPTTRQESWKYTDLRALEKRRFEGADEAYGLDAKALAPFCPAGLEHAHRVVFVDGHYAPGLSAIGELPAGVRLQALSAALAQPSPALDNGLGATLNGYANPFTDMNAAFVSDGLVLTLDPDAVCAAPIHLLSVSSGAREGVMSQLRHLLRLGANSQATVIEHQIGLGEAAYFCNAVTEAETADGARLTRYRVQQESAHGYHVSSFNARQGRDSRVVNYGVDLGGRLVRVDTNSDLAAEGAEVHFYGVYAPTGRQHIDNHTRIDHSVPHGTSREAYKGILSGRGRGVFNGKVVVHKNAQKTDSEQSSDALLLSKGAEVDAKPELEIYADDVKCAHGATVGQLDEDALFYLQSRGVDAAGARAILTYSFADELLQGIALAPLRELIEAAFLAKLPEGGRYAGLL